MQGPGGARSARRASARSQDGRRAGPALFAEFGVAHAYEVLGDEPARFLVVATPAVFELFVAEIARHADELRLPEPADPDPKKMAAIARRYGIELVGPPGTMP